MKLLVLIATTLLVSVTTFAQTRRTSTFAPRSPAAAGYNHEITTNLTGGTFISAKQCKDCSTGSAFIVSGSYLRSFQENLQLGGEGAIRILSKEYGNGSSETLLDVVAVGAYNLSSDFANSIYGKAGVGLYSIPKSNTTGYETAVGLFVGGGKRFAWLNNVSYSPELRLVKKGDIDLGIQIDVLNFSIVW